MRILVVTNLYPTTAWPGRSTFVKEQVESLREYCPDLTIDVYVIEGSRPRGEYLRAMIHLPLFVRKGKYDVVHAHFGLSLISVIFVRAPVVVTFHGSDLLRNPTRYISKLLAPKASKVVVVAERLREQLGYGEVIPCGICVEHFLLPSCYANRPSPILPGSLKVLFPSNPSIGVKDYGLFRAVCRELERRGNRVEEVHLFNVSRKDVPEVYWGCDVMLLTSVSEGSPTVVKEAIAAKLPFVSVDVGDVGEWVRFIKFGVVVPNRKPEIIADKVVELLAGIRCRLDLSNHGCLEAMDMRNIAARIRAIYDGIVEGSH